MSKKIVSFLVATLVALSVPAFSSPAQADIAGGFTYTLAEGQVTITGCVGYCPTDLVIPATLDDNPVVAIAPWTFAWLDFPLVSLTLPNSLHNIGDSAFEGNSLTSVTIPGSVTRVGSVAFRFNSLSAVTFVGNAPFDGGDVFHGNDSLLAVDVPYGSTGYGATFSSVPVRVADAPEVFTYTTDADNNVTVTGCVDTCPADLVFPDTLGGNPVTAIGDFSFYLRQLTSVTIPASVTSIGFYAFYMNLLTSVTLPSSLTSIAPNAFYDNKLTSVTIPSSVSSIDSGAFGLNQLTSVTIPSSVTSIGYAAFIDNLLTSVTFQGDAPHDPGSVFEGNVDLFAIHVPFSAIGWTTSFSGIAVHLGDAPFIYTTDSNNNVKIEGYNGVMSTDLVIPATLGGNPVTAISAGAFVNRGLTSVRFTGNAPSDGGGIFDGNENLSVIDVPYGATGWGSTFSGVTLRVGKYAPFTYETDAFNSLTITGYSGTVPTDLVIPATLGGNPVTRIWYGAFANKSLTSVSIPSSVYSVLSGAFSNNSLTSVTFTGNAPYDQANLFLGNAGLTAIDVPYDSTGWGATFSGVPVRYGVSPLLFTTDGENKVTVTGCRSGVCPATLVIPANLGGNPVKSIGAHAFDNAHLKSVSIPSSVTDIGASAFAHNSLTALSIPSSLTSLGSFAFATNLLTSVTLPSTLTDVASGAFYNNLLTSVTIPNSVTSIGADAFNVNSLSSVTIPSSVTSINQFAFAVNSLTSVVFDGNAPTNGGSIFYGNTGLVTVDVPYGSTGWDSYFANISVRVGKYGPFTYSTDTDNNLTITGYAGIVPTDLVIPATLGGNPVVAIGDSAFVYAGLTSVSLPNSLLRLEASCFSNNSLTSVTIPSSVVTIGSNAFVRNGLTSVTIPNGVTNVGVLAFAINHLTSVTLGSSLASIGSWAFWDNTIESVTFPASVTSVSQAAFANNSLTSVNFKGAAPLDGGTVFDSNSSLTEIDVPYGLAGWGETFSGVTVRVAPAPFTYTTDADNNVTVTGCVDTCPADLFLPATLGGNPVVAIADNAFKGAGITSVVLPDSLVSVGAWAFENNSLTAVTLPSSLTTLYAGAFYINSLTSVIVPSSVTTIADYVFAKNALTSIVFQGNAPAVGNNVFENDADLLAVDVSYGTTGWGATFSGTPVHVVGAPLGKPASAPKIRSVKSGNTQVTLGIWAPRKNGGTEITGYEYTVDDGATWVAVDPSSTATSLVITGLENGTRYTVQVRAVNTSGGGAASNLRSFTPRTLADAPTITALTGLSAKIKVELEAPAFNGGAKITRYAYSINEGDWRSWSVGGNGTTQVITGLKKNASCSIRIRAYTVAGWGAISEAVTAVTAIR